jgi:hypothetical protein
MHVVHTSVVRPVLVVLLTAIASPLLAQTPDESSTRASLMEQARDTLATESVAPRRSSIERFLYWYDNQHVLDRPVKGWKGIHFAGGDFPAGAGLKFGIGYDRPLSSAYADPRVPNHVDLTARGAYSTSGYARVGLGVDARNLGGSHVDIRASGQYYEFPQEDFFGLGMDSQETNRTNYLLDAIESGVAVRWKPSRLELGGGVAYFGPRIGRGTDSLYPSTDDVFSDTETPGLGSETDYLKADLSAAYDWLDNPAYPHAGGRYAVGVTNFDDRNQGLYNFYRVDVNVQQYVPLPDRYRLIALRARGVFTTADSDSTVPFYLQPTLGGASHLRGFRESRFRDQNAVLLGAEYRWEAWWALDVALFADAGVVAPTRERLSWRETEVGYGLGFRFHSNRAFAARLDLAFSREGFIPLLRFEHAF